MPEQLDEVGRYEIQEKIREVYDEFSAHLTISFDAFLGFFFRFNAKSITSPYNCYFRGNNSSIVNTCLVELTDNRAVWKKKKKVKGISDEELKRVTAIELAYKLIGNLFYGQMGNIHGRVYHPAIAMSITLAGQYTTGWTNRFFKNCPWKFSIVYNDTDSNYIFDKHYTPKREQEFIKFFEKVYHKQLWEMHRKEFNVSVHNNCVILEREKRWFRVVFLSKKRYVGMVEEEDGEKCHKLVARGVELRRTGTIKFSRDFQNGYYDLLFDEEMPSAESLHEYISTAKERFMGLEINKDNIDEVIKRQKLNKQPKDYKANTPVVNLMKRCIADGEELQIGDLLNYVIVESPAKTQFIVTSDQYLNTGIYTLDRDAYWDKEIYKPIIDQLFDLYPKEDWGQYHINNNTMRTKKYNAVKKQTKRKKQEDRLKTVNTLSTYKRFSWTMRMELIELLLASYANDPEVIAELETVKEKHINGEITEVVN